jgi:ATP-dependent Clp protease ATP-binding subunit ClpX
LFEYDNANLVFTDEAISEVAKEAIRCKTGARGLRTIIESTLLETMYTLPDTRDSLRTVVIDKAVIAEKAKPQIRIEKATIKEKKPKKETEKKLDNLSANEQKEAN